MAAKSKFYAVAVGRKPGIYQEWYGPDGAEAQVNGFSGARYQGFPSRATAQAWLAKQLHTEGAGKTGQENKVPRNEKARQDNRLITMWNETGGKPAQVKKTQNNAAELVTQMVSQALAGGQVVIFTDGACTGNPGPGGWAAVLRYGDHREEISGGYARTTNNRMELTACIEGLRLLQRPSSVVLFSDSRYVTQAIEKGWARRWRANHWMRNATAPAENPDLWEELLALCEKHQVRFVWLRGHAGHPENERCDQMAVEASHQPGLPVDPGYKR